MTRFAAPARLAMTAVIRVFVYPDAWPAQLARTTALLHLAGRGPGRLSRDRALRL